MTIKIMFVLMLFLNGNVIEFMNGWKDNADTNTRYACEKHKVEVEDNWEGREVVRKILD